MPLEVIRGNMRSFEVTWGHSRSLEVTQGHLRPLEVTWGHLRSLETTRANQCWGHSRSFEAIRGLYIKSKWKRKSLRSLVPCYKMWLCKLMTFSAFLFLHRTSKEKLRPAKIQSCGFCLFAYKPNVAQGHGVWKSQKKSHSTLRAKRAKFTFWVNKS